MSLRKLIGTGFVVLMLAGCSAPVAARIAAPQASSAKTIDVASLPRDVDVQTAATLRTQPDVVILDVREQTEWDSGHIPGALFIPINDVPSRLKEIPADKTVIVQCRSGNRSSKVTDYLRGQGMTNVHNMTGGIAAWEAAGLPVEK